MHSVLTEEDGRKQKRTIQMKSKGKKRDKKDHEAKSEYIQTEWVLCSEDWRDIVITYVPQLNNIPIEDNYAEISQKEIKKAYKQYKRRTQMKSVKLLHMLSSLYNLNQNLCCNVPYIYFMEHI